MFDYALNLWPILAATVAGFAVGFCWYSPFMFGTIYMKAMGMSEKDCNKGDMWKLMVSQFLTNLLTAYVLAMVLAMTFVGNMQDALMMGFWLWLGFMATISFTTYLWSPKKNFQVFLVDAGQNLTSLLVMGAILFQFG